MGNANDIHAVLEAIGRGNRFLVTGHARPDGDAIGSMLALGMILQELGKQADLVSCDRVPLIYRTLPGNEKIRSISHVEGDYDGVILLECNNIERSRLEGLEGRFLINIDHHVSGRNFAHVNWIDTGACAVAEMVYRLGQQAGAEITAAIATCLYTAVLTDTGSFCYHGTDAHTFALARALVEHGASPVAIAEDVYFRNPTSKLLLLGAALGNLKREGRLAWMWVTHNDMVRTCAAEEDCEGIANYAISISGVEIAVFLRELPDHQVRLSIRSKGQVDVSRIAEQMGGGGHANASGCTLDGPLPAAMEAVLNHLRRDVLGTIDVA
jgi:bifunctional oligoribonuclease and PAP phosphatase NrnA